MKLVCVCVRARARARACVCVSRLGQFQKDLELFNSFQFNSGIERF